MEKPEHTELFAQRQARIPQQSRYTYHTNAKFWSRNLNPNPGNCEDHLGNDDTDHHC